MWKCMKVLSKSYATTITALYYTCTDWILVLTPLPDKPGFLTPGFTWFYLIVTGKIRTSLHLCLPGLTSLWHMFKVYLGFPTLTLTWFSWHGPWQYSVRLVRAWIIRSTLCSLMYNPSSPSPPVVLPQIESRNCRVSHIKLYGLAWFGWLRKKFYPFKY